MLGKIVTVPDKILSGAQSFGYGPASKLVVLVNHLRNDGLWVDFWGQESALNFAETNLAGGGTILSGEPLASLDPALYRAVLTVMDPRLAAWGYYHNLPVLAVDSLYWFWDWSQLAHEQARIDNLLSYHKAHTSLAELVSSIEALPPHVQQYATHSMASQSLIQHYPGGQQDESINDRLRLVKVGPIVDTKYRKKVKRDTLLVSLSGMLSPLVSRGDADVYMKLVLELLDPVLSALPVSVTPIFTVNPALLQAAKAIFGEAAVTMDHSTFLKTLNRSLAVLAPAGITTLYECLAYETPMLFLPEQHDGHFSNYDRLARLTATKTEFRAMFPEGLLGYHAVLERRDRPKTYVKALYTMYRGLLTHPEEHLFALLKDQLSEPLLRVVRGGAYNALAESQKTFAELSFGHLSSPLEETSAYFRAHFAQPSAVL